MTNSELADQIPPLKPPRGEIPAGYWEQHGVWIIVGALLLICLVVWIIWLLSRKGKAAETPPEIEAWQSLIRLRNGPQTGEILSQASRVTKTYFGRAFNLSPGEHTTAEMSALAQASPQIGAELSQKLTALLVELDRRKFAGGTKISFQQSLDETAVLIQSAETRRQELRQLEAAKQQHARQS